MEDNKLYIEEQRREVQHADVKARVINEVNSEIVSEAERAMPQDQEQVRQVAEDLRGKAVREVAQAEREVTVARGVARVSQIVDFGFFLIYGLLALRFLLSLMAAKSSAGFVQFIRGATAILYGPFQGIVPSPSLEGGFTLALPILLALLVYALLHGVINSFLRLLAHRKTSI